MSTSDRGELVGVRDEVARRLVHASGAVVPFAWVAGVPWSYLMWFLVVGAAGAAVLEVLRLFFGLEWVVFDTLTRWYEQENPAGYALYMWSSTVVAVVFRNSPEIAAPALFALMIGDPVSGLLASGELRAVKRKRVLVAMFVTAFAFAWPFLPLSAAVLGALGAMVADGVKPQFRGFVVDDNLSIPLVFAAGAWVGVRYLPPIVDPLLL